MSDVGYGGAVRNLSRTMASGGSMSPAGVWRPGTDHSQPPKPPMSNEEKMASVPSGRRHEHLVEGKRQEWLEGMPEGLTRAQEKDLRRAIKSGERLEVWHTKFPEIPPSIMKLIKDYAGDDKKMELLLTTALRLPVKAEPKEHVRKDWSQTKEEGDRILREAMNRSLTRVEARQAEEARQRAVEAERVRQAEEARRAEEERNRNYYVRTASGNAAQQLKAIRERTGTNPKAHYKKPSWPGGGGGR